MKNVYLTQFSTVTLGTYYFFPYSTGLLWAYAQLNDTIKSTYTLKRFFYRKDHINTIVESLDNPAVFGLSAYVWNINYNLELAKAVKTVYPECLVLMGGPGVPDKDTTYLQKYPFIDYCIHKEGELAFTELLLGTDPYTIPGLSFLDKEGSTHYSTANSRIKKIDDIPSPYLIGLFDDIVTEAKELGIVVNGITETNRGCPYKCTFCDWGGVVFSKVFNFDSQRVYDEITWMAHNEIELISLADANFGIFVDRDSKIIEHAVATKQQFGFPKLFDTSWTKNTKPETLQMAKSLLDSGMLRKFVMSLQTLDEGTLKNIKRTNLDGSKFKSLIEDRSVSCASELIVGLPGETVESFKSGIGQLIDQDIKVISNPLTVFPNSEMSKPEYIKQWKIDIESFPSDWSSEYGVEEYEDLVVATSSFTRSDWEHMLLWNWSTIFLETYYWTDIINREQPLDTVTWYNWCLDWFTDNHNPLQEQLIYWQDHLTTKRSYELWGGGVGTVDIDLNTAILEDVTWSTTLRICTNEYCDYHYIPRLDDSVFVRQQNNHVTMPGYKSLAHQLVANRWNFLSRQ